MGLTMDVLHKIIAGGPHRKTRLHDHQGSLVPLDRLVRNGPKALLSTFNRVALGRFIKSPWLSYDGQKILEQHLTPQSRVLEFGSGASTGWFADRAGFVLSHEDDPKWFGELDAILGPRPNVVRTLHTSMDSYISVEPEYAKPFDLILVDGSHRDRCVENNLSLLAEGGILYLDNSDKHACEVTGDVPRARAMLAEQVAMRGKKVRSIVDFSAAQLYANEAILLYN